MRRKANQSVVLDFNGPGSRPDAIAQAFAEYDAAATAVAACIGEIRDVRQSLGDEQNKDLIAYAEALKKDPDAKAIHKHETAARARLSALEQRKKALDLNADEAGDRLLAAIVEGRDEWLGTLRGEEAEAETRLREALDAALPAMEALRVARASAAWVEGFDKVAARLGQHARYHSTARLKIVRKTNASRVLNANDTFVDPEALLRLAATVLDPPEPPPVYRPANSKEAQFEHAA